VGLTYDTGDYDATWTSAHADGRRGGLRGAQGGQRPAKGLKRGLGYSAYIEACGIAPSNLAGALGARAGLFEAGEVRVHPTGKVTVFTGSHSHGQGHETTFAQVVADKLGIPMDDIDIVHGDTGKVPFGMGTYGSRSLAVGGTAIVKAVDKIIAKGKKIAAHLLEASDTDIEFEDGKFKVAGTDKAKVPSREVALTAYVPHNYPLDKLEPGLNENAFYDPTNFTYPAGSYICEVEVDPATGTPASTASRGDDFGNVVNPMIVEGQVHGGLAQGIGQALLEHGVYDKESGQLLTGSYMDYAMPRADDLPSFTVDRQGHALHAQPAGREGLRRGRCHRLAAGGHQRHLRRPGRQGRADAGHALHRLEGRQARLNPGDTTMQASPTRPRQADAAKAARPPSAKLIAGGQSLLPSMKLGLAAPEALVDLGGHRRSAGHHRPAARQDRRDDHATPRWPPAPTCSKAIPALAELAGNIGDRQVRNRGTIGGSLANNDPAACYPAAVLGLGATVHTNTRASPPTTSSRACTKPRWPTARSSPR
jgi:hypothetical protein